MANGVTSQWEDIHVKLGNYVERPKETPQHVFTKEAIDKAEGVDPLSNKNLDQLGELEDDFEDDFLKTYMDKRKKEMEDQNKKATFTGVKEISKQDYLEEVNNAPKGSYVVLLLFQTYNEDSLLIAQKFNQLSQTHLNVKFLKSVATRCVENFRDSDVPTIIIYQNGKLKHNLLRVNRMLKEISIKNLEWLLKDKGVLPKDDEEEDEDIEKYGKFVMKKNVVNRNNGDRSDSDDDDRGYATTTFKKY